MGWADIFILAGIACLAASLIYARKRGAPAAGSDIPTDDQAHRLIYVDGVLVDASASLGVGSHPNLHHLTGLQELVVQQFSNVDLTSEEHRPAFAVSKDGQTKITVAGMGNTLRISLFGRCEWCKPVHNPTGGLLELIHKNAPQLIWQYDAEGNILWMNASYEKAVLASSARNSDLFPDLEKHVSGTERVQPVGQDQVWFDVTTIAQNDQTLCFATETTALVRADKDRREFVKTLGKTFADLATGLAIFDRERQLKMFNPALLEMSKLPFTFLSGRPRIDTFLDRLRELQMMPEPKDYASWREQFTAVETGALDGTFCENWALPDGQTFRVTGRPHPDGAFALLFEDISAELSLTRRFRTEIETSQAVLDNIPEAIAVFSNAGTLVLSNSAYAELWGTETVGLLHRDATRELTTWKANTVTSPAWAELRELLHASGHRKPWVGDMLLLDGRPLRCHATPLEGGMTMLRFSFTSVARPVVQKLMQVDMAIPRRQR